MIITIIELFLEKFPNILQGNHVSQVFHRKSCTSHVLMMNIIHTISS